MSTTFIFTILLIVSILTTLTVQGLKSLIPKYKWDKIPTNIVTVCVSLILTVGITVGYLIYTETMFNSKMAVELLALLYLSFLVSTNGYDKVIQAIKQIQNAAK